MMRKIYNSVVSVIILLLLVCFIGIAGAENEPADSVEETGQNENIVSGVDVKVLETEADKYFYDGINISDKKEKETYLSEALSRYMFLLGLKPNDAIICTQIAVIYDNLGSSVSAKEYFTRAVNLENLNPFANFYFGEYYYSRREYRKALEYYTLARSNGYAGLYEVNFRLATIYEKLGDIDRAKVYYDSAMKLNPNAADLSGKIKSLNKAYYSKSDYK